jgi:hypothetical protein
MKSGNDWNPTVFFRLRRRAVNYLFSMLIGLTVACLGGCSSNPMVGIWKAQMPEAERSVLIEFKADGTFVISANDGYQMHEVKGIYNVDGFNVTLIPTEGDGTPLDSRESVPQTVVLSQDKRSFVLQGPGLMVKVVKLSGRQLKLELAKQAERKAKQAILEKGKKNR